MATYTGIGIQSLNTMGRYEHYARTKRGKQELEELGFRKPKGKKHNGGKNGK